MRPTSSATSRLGGGGGGGQGQMVINMKTTVTTSGGQHNGLVVHSAVQSAAASPSTSSWMPSSAYNDERIEMMRSNTSLHRAPSSPLPIQMVPSTSRESLVSFGGGPGRPSRRPDTAVSFQTFQPPVERRPPSPPPSPIYSFKGRDSPPDEFIQPTKLVLNVFRPKHPETPLWQAPIPPSHVTPDTSGGGGGIQLLNNRPAMLNDAVTTTTTVEVFRAPTSSEHPHHPELISLTAAPIGGAPPLLVRAHGPAYEHWRGESRHNNLLMAPDDVASGAMTMTTPKGVQWKERLVEDNQRSLFRYRDTSSDYDEIAEPAHFIHHDYRPKPSQFQPVTHPMIMGMGGSRDDLSRPPPPAPLSPLYIVPDRRLASPGQWSRRSHVTPPGVEFRDEQRENEHNQHRERYQHRRSKSSTRDNRPSSLRNRSHSPAATTTTSLSRHASQEFVLPAHSPIGSTLMLASPDPNEVPGRPASARSQEIFALYQTRDAYNRIVDQL